MKSKVNKPLIAMYVLGHFIVDFSCAFLLFRMINVTDSWYLSILIYNFCAFALQMPIGLLADRINRNSLFAALGCILILFGYGLSILSVNTAIVDLDFSLTIVTFAGIGNALFHVGGGIDVLNAGKERAKLLGVFVAPGAFGIYFGTIFGKEEELSAIVVAIVLFLIALLILFLAYLEGKDFRSENVPVSFIGVQSSGIILSIACLILVVCLRSYTGMSAILPWKGNGNWGIALVCGVVFGKMFGGLICDYIGAKRASVLSLGLAAFFYLFAFHPILGTLAVFLFNMTMPITLWGITRILKGAKGFAFGLLTFALYIGFLPVYLEWELIQMNGVTLAIASLMGLCLLLIGLHKVVK